MLSFGPERIKATAERLLDSLFPRRCPVCQRTTASGTSLCSACYNALPHNLSACRQCALPLADDAMHGNLCGRCIRKQPFYDYAASLFRYEGEVISLVHQLKFSQKIGHSRPLGELLCKLYGQQVFPQYGHPDCLLPVPLHPLRLRWRGYNQSTEIVRVLAKRHELLIEQEAVIRQRKTVSQTGLDASARQKNMRSAFGLAGKLGYRHVLIIDDVVTTGATVNELARLLKRNGVQQVGVMSIARAPIK
ncbi:MAG TPA: ComF family protein [Gammaproteobacteria bacterium]|nr:ComF family protein [Gammaproteobacteria bacterium]